jgi:hypothetical protein
MKESESQHKPPSVDATPSFATAASSVAARSIARSWSGANARSAPSGPTVSPGPSGALHTAAVTDATLSAGRVATSCAAPPPTARPETAARTAAATPPAPPAPPPQRARRETAGVVWISLASLCTSSGAPPPVRTAHTTACEPKSTPITDFDIVSRNFEENPNKKTKNKK